jgi:hypothetical protein
MDKQPDQLTALLQQQITRAVDSMVQQHVIDFINDLAMDPEWMEKIETLVSQNFSQKITDLLNTVDVNQLVLNNLDAAIDRYHARILEGFRTNGIHDQSTANQITVTDEVTLVNNPLMAHSLAVEHDTELQGTTTVQDLVVKNTINTDAPAWQQLREQMADATMSRITQEWRDTLVQQVLDLAKTQGIEFGNVDINGFPLIMGNRLNPDVTVTNIQKLGVLQNITVSGRGDFFDTLSVRQKRIGVNTSDPDSALSVWDEEISLSIGKHDKETAFVGTSRRQRLALGVNRQPVIVIDENNLVSMPALRIDRWKVGHSSTVPGHSGTRGDIMFNSDPKPNTPFAWVCLGAARWQALMAVPQS